MILMIKDRCKIMFWNCVGAGSQAFVSVSKCYMRQNNLDIFVVMETRVDPAKLCKKFNNLGFSGFKFTKVRCFVGGIGMGWNKSKMRLTILRKHLQFIHAKINIGDEAEWKLIEVYASLKEEDRRELWQELQIIVDSVDNGWVVGGDFNDILGSAEKRGRNILPARKCAKFQERINGCNLMDLGYTGYKYTWRGPISHGAGRIYEELDRVLGNELWRLQFPNVGVQVLTRPEFSNHHPIILSLRDDTGRNF
ncbi:unnamed protein product [Lathyrus oleraceus]